LLGQCHHLGNHQGIAGHDHLIAGLGHLPCPYPPHVGHPLAEHLQNRPGTLQVRGLATHHDRQGARLGAWRAAGHRGIQPGHAAQCGQLGRHFPGCGGLEAGEIHQQLPAAPALGDALLAKYHLAHNGGVGQAQQQHVAVTAQVSGAGSQPRPCSHQCCAFFRAAVPDRQRVTGGQQAPAHRQPHQANPGKPQRRQCSTHERLLAEDQRSLASGQCNANSTEKP